MGVSTRHVVMIGIEVEYNNNPYHPDQEWDKYDTWLEEYSYHNAKPGDFVYFADNYGSQWAVFGKLIEMSGDVRWEPAYLEFAPRIITKEDKQAVLKEASKIFDITDCKPELYCFSHCS